MPVFCELSMNGMRGEIVGSTQGADAEQIIDEWPHSWPKGTVTYRLNNLSPDIENRKHQIRAVTVAFRVWQLRIKDLKLKRVYDSFTNVDINISFEPLSHFRSKGVLAHAIFPGQGEPSGDIEINDEWHWVAATKWQTISKPPLTSVLIHEIGHSLGLRHDTSTTDSIMYPSFSLGTPKNKLHKNDIERIQSRYGKRRLSQRIIDYFIKRRTQGYDYR